MSQPTEPTAGNRGRFQIPTRNRSVRQQEAATNLPALSVNTPPTAPMAGAPKTAPLTQERTFREAMAGSELRAASNDRSAPAVESDEESAVPGPSRAPAPAQHQGPSFYSNLVQNSSRAATGIGRASRGLIGRFTRTGSNVQQMPSLENYQYQTLDLPLIEQTRKTRIKKSLKGAGDKTEYWMPSLPYRCIDYLNSHGVDSEGLYRVPGSTKEVKYWKVKFDIGPDYDVDLLAEGIELYDINVVGSMLKDWLRSLPEPLFPKDAQARIANQCAGAERTPQVMRDELSRLPPFNYYLLFALTCHISLLHSHAAENKMNYGNLCICFQPCVQIDNFCFQFLVMDWRNCWQGCWTELEYYQQETQLEEQQAAVAAATAAEKHPAKTKKDRAKHSFSNTPAAPASAPPSRDHVASPPPAKSRPGHQTQTSNGSTRIHPVEQQSRSATASPGPGQSKSKANASKAEAGPFSQDMGNRRGDGGKGGPPVLDRMQPIGPLNL